MKVVAITFSSVIFLLWVLSLIFASVSVRKWSDVPCRNDPNAENAKDNAIYSAVLAAIGIGLFAFLLLFVAICDLRARKKLKITAAAGAQ